MKYSNYIIPIFLCLNASFCFSQSNIITAQKNLPDFYKTMTFSDSIHNTNEIKCKNIDVSIIQWDLKDSILFKFDSIYVFSSTHPTDSIKLNTFFTATDIEFINEQFKYYIDKHFTWKDINSWNLINRKTNKKINEYWTFSEPIFSKDNNKCLIKSKYTNIQNDIEHTVLFIKTKRGIWTEKGFVKYYKKKI
jgi:hypothetical protein